MADRPVIVIDYGVGNTGSILNMLKKIGVQAAASANVSDIRLAEKIILPGVGSFDTAMSKLDGTGIIPMLEKRVLQEGAPLLGICLGMQILTKRSEEGRRAGLGWIDAEIRRFKPDLAKTPLRIPHMGWNEARPVGKHPLFTGLEGKARYYFVHSYHAVCNPDAVLCTTEYGYEFPSGLIKDNIFGVQFHPEKSHKFGLTLLRNFAGLSDAR